MNAAELQGIGLSFLSRVAQSPVADTLRLRRPIERLLYSGSKAGFKLASTAARQFASAPKAGRQRLTAQSKGLFDLSLSDEQQMMRDMLQRFASEAIRPAAAAADHDSALPQALLTQAQELGLNFYAVPEAYGGMANEQSSVTHVLAGEDLGYGDFSLALMLLSSMGVANAITRYGSEAQQAKYLPAFASEQAPIASFAVQESTPGFNPYELNTRAQRVGDAYQISGEKCLVLMGQQAELLVVAAMLDGQPALFLVESHEDLMQMPDPAMGLCALQATKIRFQNTPAQRLGDSAEDYRDFLDLSALALSAVAIGTCQAVLDYCTTYANERIAFGEPISHRQSVAFMIADMAIEVDAMRMMVWRAAARAEAGMPFHREAYLAKLLCAEKAMKIANDGVQVVGGHGFTKEHPVERWYRDLRSVAILHSGVHA